MSFSFLLPRLLNYLRTCFNVHSANKFWERLDTFHKSYARFVTDRKTQSGDETPRRIRIAVIDTGVDFGHPGITVAKDKGRMKKEWCHSWVGDDAKDEDNELHGSNCAHLLHKSAPEADIYVAKVFNQNNVRDYEAENIAKVRFLQPVARSEISSTTNEYTHDPYRLLTTQ